MKKIALILLAVMALYAINLNARASGYDYYESIDIIGEGTFLSDMDQDTIESYYPKIKKKKFSGWRTHTIYKKVQVKFIAETHLSFYNEGITAIDYEYKLKKTQTKQFHVSATGSIGFTNTKTKTGFKNGLDGSLKLDAGYKESSVEEETTTIKLKVDPMTQANLYTYGEGEFTNGVAARFFAWIRTKRGGFEYMKVTTLYQVLEKIKI